MWTGREDVEEERGECVINIQIHLPIDPPVMYVKIYMYVFLFTWTIYTYTNIHLLIFSDFVFILSFWLFSR